MTVTLISCAPTRSIQHERDIFYDVHFLSNYDGDTVKFNIPDTHPLIGKEISVRVSGIDTPEIKGKTECERAKALEAKRFVKRELTGATRIDLANVSRGKYFRIVADVNYDGKSLSKELLKRSLGYRYSGGKKINWDWCQKKN